MATGSMPTIQLTPVYEHREGSPGNLLTIQTKTKAEDRYTHRGFPSSRTALAGPTTLTSSTTACQHNFITFTTHTYTYQPISDQLRPHPPTHRQHPVAHCFDVGHLGRVIRIESVRSVAIGRVSPHVRRPHWTL